MLILPFIVTEQLKKKKLHKLEYLRSEVLLHADIKKLNNLHLNMNITK